MSAIAPYPIRLFCDLAAPNNLFDLNRSAAPSFYRGDDIEIDIGIGEGGALLAPTIASSGTGGIASVTAQLFAAENDTNAPMMSGTVLAASMNLTLTQVNWNAGGSANSHAQFIFPNSQTAVEPERRGQHQLLAPHHSANDRQHRQNDHAAGWANHGSGRSREQFERAAPGGVSRLDRQREAGAADSGQRDGALSHADVLQRRGC